MEPNIDWTGIVHTCRSAVPTSRRQVKNALVLEVSSASIRNAEIRGFFELSDVPVPFSTYRDGLTRAEVVCLWFGRKPPTSWMHVTITGKWKLHQHYSGPVVENISKP